MSEAVALQDKGYERRHGREHKGKDEVCVVAVVALQTARIEAREQQRQGGERDADGEECGAVFASTVVGQYANEGGERHADGDMGYEHADVYCRQCDGMGVAEHHASKC